MVYLARNLAEVKAKGRVRIEIYDITGVQIHDIVEVWEKVSLLLLRTVSEVILIRLFSPVGEELQQKLWQAQSPAILLAEQCSKRVA